MTETLLYYFIHAKGAYMIFGKITGVLILHCGKKEIL
jgi:hypothetical protein